MAITYVEIDGGKLTVEVEGEGPLIVCSPAMGDNRDAFAPLATALVAAGYRVARFDLRGHGDSTADFRHYGDEAIADDYLAVIGALGGGPAVLVGASMSAAGSVIAEGRNPEQVAGLVLIAPFLRGGNKLMVWILRIAILWPWGPFVWRSYSGTLWPGLADKGKERAASTTALLTRPGRWAAFQATVAGANHNLVTPWLGRTQAPAIVVIGDADPDWTDPLAEAKWVASNFTNAETITVPGAGHAPMLENPDIVTPGVLRFLEKIQFNQKGASIATTADV